MKTKITMIAAFAVLSSGAIAAPAVAQLPAALHAFEDGVLPRRFDITERHSARGIPTEGDPLVVQLHASPRADTS